MSGHPIDGEALGDQTIETVVSMYETARRQQPEEEPHIWLGNVWLGRAQAVHDVDITESGILKIALYETYLCSCVKHPQCARALGLYFLFKEHAQLIEKHPKYAMELDELIGPVLEARDNGSIEQLHRKYNPKTAARDDVGFSA